MNVSDDALSPARDGRRLKILRAAYDVFLVDGFAAASMSAIAATCGGSKATLYSYFKSKEALFTSVVDQECERVITLMFDGGTVRGGLESGLWDFAMRYTRLVLSDETMQFMRMVIAASSQLPALGEKFYNAGPGHSRARLVQYMSAQPETAHLDPSGAERLAQQFCDLCISGLYNKRLLNIIPPPSDDQIAMNARAAIETLFATYFQ